MKKTSIILFFAAAASVFILQSFTGNPTEQTKSQNSRIQAMVAEASLSPEY